MGQKLRLLFIKEIYDSVCVFPFMNMHSKICCVGAKMCLVVMRLVYR